ncbi:MAG: hypothetical protein PHR45_04670 [Muribaculaceae bacterium]|nr:hypothetical protein [Muribaculaceae bacterium]
MNYNIIALLVISLSIAFNGICCTSAIVSGKITKNGRPLLWKNRDCGEENNKIERITSKNGRFEYIALFNASDKFNKEAWAGMNSMGFAIMNTASYNLKDDNIKEMDKEGIIMSEALSKCVTINDFEQFIINHKKPLGVEANFGVIDANGDGAYFEVNNTTYTKYRLEDSNDGILIRTNYSYSGRQDEGYGYIREQNAKHLLARHILAKDIEPITFTEELSKTFYNSLLNQDVAKTDAEWVFDQDYIPRNSSSASIVIEGIAKNETPELTTMWIALGYPPCSELRAVWLDNNNVPNELRGIANNGTAQLCNDAVARKNEVFSITRGSGNKYLNIKMLYNSNGTGYAQTLGAINKRYYYKTLKELESKRLDK